MKEKEMKFPYRKEKCNQMNSAWLYTCMYIYVYICIHTYMYTHICIIYILM